MGSEMCIRDRSNGPAGEGSAAASGPSPSFSFGQKSPAKTVAAKNTYGHQNGSRADGGASPTPIPKPPLFGSLFSGNGGDSASSAAGSSAAGVAGAVGATDPSTSKPFAALFGNSGAGVWFAPNSVHMVHWLALFAEAVSMRYSSSAAFWFL